MNPYLGIALGAGTQEWGQQEKNRRQNEMLDLDKLRSQQQTEMHGQQMQVGAQNLEAGKSKIDRMRRVDQAGREYAEASTAIQRGDFAHPSVMGFAQKYAAGSGLTPTISGNMVNLVGQDGQIARSIPLETNALQAAAKEAYMSQLASMDPDSFYKNENLALDRVRTNNNTRQTDASVANSDWQIDRGKQLLPVEIANTQSQITSRGVQDRVSMGQLSVAQAGVGLRREEMGMRRDEANERRQFAAGKFEEVGFTSDGHQVLRGLTDPRPFVVDPQTGSRVAYAGPIIKNYSPQSQGIQPVQGNPGMFRDPATNVFYTLDGQNNMVEVPQNGTTSSQRAIIQQLERKQAEQRQQEAAAAAARRQQFNQIPR